MLNSRYLDCVPILLFLLLCFGSIFMHSKQFTDPYIVPKWIVSFAGVLLLSVYFVAMVRIVKINILIILMIIPFVCLLQAFYGFGQYFGWIYSESFYKVVGSYDNPAGFAATLCAGLPFIGFVIRRNQYKYIRFVALLAGIIISIAVIISNSRTGLVCVATICVLFLYGKKQKRILQILFFVGFTLLIIGSYWMKKDSADGRLLIWKCAINMIKDSPILGYGMGGFEAHYMDYQAKYFETHGWQGRFAMLADNVKLPFNEYLSVLLSFGLIGLLILFVAIAFLIYCCKKNPTDEKKIAACTLILIAIFSLFSYPFTYPFIWVITFLSIFIIAKEYVNVLLAVPLVKKILCVFALVCSTVCIYKLVERIQAELEWGKISQLALSKSNDEALTGYKKLEDIFENNPYFLYNYAAVLLNNEQYEKSLDIALKCRQYWADYDLELIIGENCQRLNKPELAEKYYKSASMMCPSRFLPLYKLFYLYKENGEKERAFMLAETFINKPMKIKTATIKKMKRDLKRELQKMSTPINLE